MNHRNSGVEPASIVIFGASGDLTRRKLIPALHSLGCEGLLPKTVQVLGVARSQLTGRIERQEPQIIAWRGARLYV